MFYEEILNKVLSSINLYGGRKAFCINEQFYTYREFAQYVSKIRIALQLSPINNTKVGLVVNDDIETYASIFALWMEGLAYVPLHPNWPLERCEEIIDQVGIDLIIDSSENTRYSYYCIINSSILEFTLYCLDPIEKVSDSALAYILFTSGSTGKPKGVTLSRLNVASFMKAFWDTGIIITEKDRCLQCFDLTFDVSVQGYLVPLTKGACCYTVPAGQVKYVYVSGLIEDQKLTFGSMAPSMLRYLKPYFDELDATSLKYCILTAEACPLSLMEDWYKCATNAELYDFYGPTEATIYCTYYKLTKGGLNKTLNGTISIGKPLSDVTAIILDESGKEMGPGEKGELCVAGGQITPGYWQNDEMNTKSFFEMTYKGGEKRFYHTGDLCYIDSDGDIMYSGRLDNQVKIQGFRVELSEIEFHVRTFLKDKNAVCIAFNNEHNLTEIALFLESEPFEKDELMNYLRSKMPQYMIPTKVVFKPVFPLNSNDKVDRKELKKLLQ